MNVNANRDYREILREQYEERVRKNPRYSLRAFARDLGVAPSRIVEVLNYKRGLSRVVASRIVEQLGFTTTEAETFLQLVDLVHGRSSMIRSRANQALGAKRAQTFTTLQVDAFKLIADWYHYAILELTSLADFESDPDWIAARLNIPKLSVNAAIQRLKRLDLLTEDENGHLRATEGMTFSTSDVPSDGLKKHHEQLLEKAQTAIYGQTVDERDLSSMTMAMRKEDLPRAKEMIRKFRRELAQELELSENKDSVYCLTTQLFRLDTEK